MCNEIVGLTTRSKTYDTIPDKIDDGGATDKLSTSTTPPLSIPLHIEWPIPDTVLPPPKGTI
jgi:hypothetical protein